MKIRAIIQVRWTRSFLLEMMSPIELSRSLVETLSLWFLI